MDSEISKQLLAYSQFLLMTVFYQVWVRRPSLCRTLLLRDRVGWRVPRAAAKTPSATTAAQVSSEISSRRICNREHFPGITLYKQLFMKSACEFKLCRGRYNPNSIGNIKYFMLSKHSDVIFKVRLPFESEDSISMEEAPLAARETPAYSRPLLVFMGELGDKSCRICHVIAFQTAVKNGNREQTREFWEAITCTRRKPGSVLSCHLKMHDF